MPGAVDNEDYEILRVTNGVHTVHPSLIPDGYAGSLDNFIIRDGILEGRYPLMYRDYPITSNSGYLGAGGRTNLPKMQRTKLFGGIPFSAVGVGSHNGAQCLLGINDNDGKISRKAFSVTTYLGGLATYNTTLYASATGGIYKIGVGSFPASITETLVAGSPTNIYLLLSHKSRLFGSSSTNRLYFTDAPAVGALPDTWSTTTNFIDFNNAASGPANIQALVSLNNYLYVFTDAGLFSVYTSGGASSWTVKMVNPDISIKSYLQVVVKNNLIYYVTENGVFVTDGFDFRLISQSLTEYFTGIHQSDPSDMCLGEFNGGLIVSVNNIDGTLNNQVFFTKLNPIAWTSIKIPRPSHPTNQPEFNAFTSLEVYIGNLENTVSYLAASFEVTNVSYFYIYAQQATNVTSTYGDVTPNITGTFGSFAVTGTTLRAIDLTLETRELFGSNFMRLKSFKELFLAFGSSFDFTVVPTLYVNMGVNAETSGLVSSPGMGDLVDTGRLFKFSIKQGLLNSIRVKLVFSFDTSTVIPYLPEISPTKNKFMFTLSQIGLVSMLSRTAPLSRAGGLQ